MGIEVFTEPLIAGYGTVAKVTVTIDDVKIHDSPGDGIFIGNSLPEATVNVSIRNSEILRAAGHLGGGINVWGAIAVVDADSGYLPDEMNFGNATISHYGVVNGGGGGTNPPSDVVPIPAPFALIGIGLAGLGWIRRSKVSPLLS
jgi:hypothetical protein